MSIDIDAVKEAPTTAIDLAAASDSGGSNTDNITNLTKPVFNVGALPKAGDVFNLYVNGSKVAATYDAAAGTLTPVTALSATTHSISYSVTNAAGVESARSPALSLVIDTTAPTTYLNSFASSLTTSTDLGLSTTDGITSNNKPSLFNNALTSTYFGEAGAVGTASLFVDGVKVAAVWDKVAGTLTPVNALTDGPHTLSFSRTDSAGNETTVSTQTYRITVDTSTPAAPTVTPDLLATADSGTSNTDNITSNTRPGFVVGDPLPGGRIDLLVDGVVVAATYSASTKTLTPNVALSEGSHTIAIVNVSAAGAQSAASPALTIDVDAVKETPALIDLAAASDSGGSNTDNITNLTKPVFNVGALPKAGDVFNLYVNGSKVAATYDAAAGTLTPVTALSATTHSISYSVTNAAGVESARSPALSLVIDTTAPTSYLNYWSSNLTAATDLGLSTTDGITSNNKPSLFNYALTNGYFSEAGAVGTANLYVDGVKVASVWDKVAGTLTPVNALTDGPHSLSYSLTDSAGNETAVSTTGAYRITVDTSTPAAPTVTPDLLATADSGTSNTDNITSNTRPGFVVGDPLPGGRIDLLVDGVVVAATYSASTKTLTPNVALSEGSHTIAIVNVSAAGAQSAASPALTIDVDAVKETPALIDLAAASDSGGSNTDNITNLTKPVFNVGALPKAGDVFNLYVNGSKVAATYDAAAGTLTPVTALSATTHSISYSVTNAAGVESARSPALSLVIDTTAPTSYLNYWSSNLTAATDLGLSTTDGITSNNKPSLFNYALTNGYFSEAGAVGTANLYVDGVKVASVWDKVAGTLTPVNALTDGPHSLSYSLTDSAGNETAVSTTGAYRITVDTSTPAAPTVTPDLLATADSGTSNTDNITSNTRPGFVVGDPLPGGRIDLLVDGVVVAATYSASTKTLTPNVALSEGSHTIAIVNVSAAGAKSAASPALTVDIDAVKEAPAALPDLADGSDSGSSTTDNLTNVTRPAFVVGALPKAGDVANLYVDGTKVAATYDAAAGTLTPNTALSATAHTITWSITNAAGIESARSAGLSMTIDTAAPTAPAALDLQTASDTGTSSTDNITANNQPSFTVGTVAATDSVSLWVDGVETPATFDFATRTITATQALTDGVHQVSIKVTDAAGNVSPASTSLKVDIRTQAPLPVMAPDLLASSDTAGSDSDDLTSVNQPVFKLPTAPANCTAVLYVDGLKVDATYDAKALTLKPVGVLSEGNHLITYAWVDSATGAESQLAALAHARGFHPGGGRQRGQ
ncbi:beta strand repeat-containing protein [Ideonella paludis]|uniref:beta strand repeat-containing protein n=1 Tax=Ideonella paludis TaxID=1233411 RepID=UPI003641A62D